MTDLAAAAWPDVARATRDGAVLLVPVGSTEQHGPHLPVTTDTDVAVALCDAAARRCPGVVVAPALAYGSSGEHRDFPGTLSVGAAVTEALLVELGRSATGAFRAVLLVSTHGGNAAPVAAALELLHREGRPVHAWSPAWPDADLHAGRTETSLLLAIDPARVKLSAAAAGDRRPLADLLPVLRRDGVRAVSANGVLGDPAGASAAEGRRLLDAAAAALAARCASLSHDGLGEGAAP